MKRAIILVLILATTVCATDAPLDWKWTDYVQAGVDRIDCLTLDGYNHRVYATSYNPPKTMIYVYKFDGSDDFDTSAVRQGTQEAGKETTQMAALADIDDNKLLDIYSSTEINAAYVRDHRLYRLQRMSEKGIEGEHNKYVWMDKDTGLVTSISFADFDGDGKNEVITSSTDNRIRAYDYDGNDKLNITLDTSLWDVETVGLQVPGYANFTDSETGETQTVEVNATRYFFLAGGYNGLYLVEPDGTVRWYRRGEKIGKVAALDTGDGKIEYIGATPTQVLSFDSEGKPAWSQPVAGVSGLDVLDSRNPRNRLLVASADDKLYFIDGEGSVKWEYTLNDTAKTVKYCSAGAESYILVGGKSGISAYRINVGGVASTDAQEYLRKAAEAYDSGNFSLAAGYYNKTLQIYGENGITENLAEITKSEKDAEKLAQADALLANAELNIAASRNDKAASLIGQAKAIYTQIGYEKGLNRTVYLEAAMKGGKPVKPNQTTPSDASKKADDDYNQAEGYYMKGAYEQSLAYANLSFQEYSDIGSESGARLAKSLMSMSMERLGTKTTETTIGEQPTLPTSTTQTAATQTGSASVSQDDIVTYSIVAVGVLILVYVVYPRKKRQPTS